MPLSEEEQRLLQQLEQALAAEDPSLASTLRGSKFRARTKRQAVAAVVGFVVGLALLMVGVILTTTILGVLGFVLMLASAYFFLAAWRARASGATEPAQPQARRTPAESESFMQRMEERWKKRRDTDL